MACFIPMIFVICTLYLNQNATVLALVGQKAGFIKVNGNFFMNVPGFQGVLAGLLTAFIGPTRSRPISSMVLCRSTMSRPISRAEYILGKGAVIGTLAAPSHCCPALLMFLRAKLAGRLELDAEQFYLLDRILLTLRDYLAVFTLLGLAMSALVAGGSWRER